MTTNPAHHLSAFDANGVYVGSAYLTWAGEWRASVPSESLLLWFDTRERVEQYLRSKGATLIRETPPFTREPMEPSP